MEEKLLKEISEYKKRFEYYNNKGNDGKSEEYLSLLLDKVGSLLILKDIK